MKLQQRQIQTQVKPPLPTWKFQDALDAAKRLSAMQGLYGRLHQHMLTNADNDDYIAMFNEQLRKHNVRADIDFVMMIEQ